jgi:heme-degrading monooxygenase HmoA
MEARVSTFAGPAGRLDEFLQGLRRVAREFAQLDGFAGGYVLVSRGSGKAQLITFWSSAETLRASAGETSKIRTQVAWESGVRMQSVETYRVLLAFGADREVRRAER